MTCSRRQGWLGGARVRGGPRASVPGGGVGGRGTGPKGRSKFRRIFVSNTKKTRKMRFLKGQGLGDGGGLWFVKKEK